MSFPKNEQEHLLKTNEDLSEILITSILDIHEQINTLDRRQFALEKDTLKETVFLERQKAGEQVRTELTHLQASLEQFLSGLQQQHSSISHSFLSMDMSSHVLLEE